MTVQIDTAKFKENGSLLLKGLFPREEIDIVREDAKDVFRAQMIRHDLLEADDPSDEHFDAALFDYFRLQPDEFISCGKQIQHLISLHRLSLDARILEVLHGLGLERPNINTRPVLYFNSTHLAKKEVYWRVFPHQDWRSMQGSLDSVVVWLPLVDVDVDLGALEVVPGSHKLGLVTDEVQDGFGKTDRFSDGDFSPVEVEQSDALFFSSFLVHRSGTNTTNRIRWSCHFRYNNLSEQTFMERGYPHSFIYKPQEELITPDFPKEADLQRIFS